MSIHLLNDFSEFYQDWLSKLEVFYDSFIADKGYLVVLSGLLNTFLIAIFGLLIGIIVGTLIAIVKIVPSQNKFVRFLRGFANAYVAFFRGTPIVVQLLISHFLLFPALGLASVSPIIEAIIAFGLNSGAYVSEMMRGGILSVDVGQTEAGRSLGLTYGKTMWHIVLPQAVKNIIPMIGNEFIVLIKETSVVSFITVLDVTKAFTSIGSANYEFMIPYLVLALIYLVIVLFFTLIIRIVERSLRKSDRN